jgi:hypothetical protein
VRRELRAAGWIVATLLFSSQLALAQFSQQGPKLVGIAGVGMALQGASVSLSSDGNTAIVGGPGDNGDTGAAWVWTRRGGVWTQQGNKLVGTGAVGNGQQGSSVSLSSDGNTAIVGGPVDDGEVGAAWISTQSGGLWTQQDNKLVGTGAVGMSLQGFSVALSGDGNTAIVGGPGDNGNTGAAWVWTRNGGVWTQQGNKLVGTGAVPNIEQGSSVALSSDGNTAIVGAPFVNDNTGAAWVFTRSNGVWAQQSVLVGSGALGSAAQGISVALSDDGNTAIVGGPYDNGGVDNPSIGAAWVFERSDGVWTQQGNKLVGTGGSGLYILQGQSVSLSADGNMAIVGGPSDNIETGAAWVWTRNGGVWTQQGNKLVGTGAVGDAGQGRSVALSGEGNTAIVGGFYDNSGIGAAWFFIRSTPTNTHDFNGDGYSDIAWQDTSGDTAIWLMSSAQVLSSAGVGTIPTAWSVVGQRDFNGDGMADLLWRDTSGDTAIWFMNGTAVASSASVGNIPTNWTVVGVPDFNGDGLGDLLWRDNSGDLAVWLMNSATVMSSAALGNVPTNWTVIGTGDFNGDGTSDILWQDNLGNTSIWFMSGTTVASAAGVGNIPTNWSVVGTGDFNGDGMADIVWRDTGGNTAIWLMNGGAVLRAGSLGKVPTTWSIVQTGDYNGDGMSDLFWEDNLGNTSIWFMNRTTVASSAVVGNIPTNWTVQSVNAE